MKRKENFFDFCRNCEETKCCTKPFFAYITKSERNRIREYLLLKNLEDNQYIKSFINPKDDGTDSNPYIIPKKNDGKCIFLGSNRKCLIQEVKPFDCRLWPFTFDYFSESNEVIFYLGRCHASKEMQKAKTLDMFRKNQIELCISSLKQLDSEEVKAYKQMPFIGDLDFLERRKLTS